VAIAPVRAATPETANSRPVRLVFAHYMVCNPRAGDGSTVEDYEKEIVDAQALGIDGFALNSCRWGDAYWKRHCVDIYEAARRLKTGFKLFISADYCCGNGPAETIDMIDSFRDHPNQLKWGGKPVFSTFMGDRQVYDTVKKHFTGANSVVFVPYFYPKTGSNHPNATDIEQVYNDYPDLDGFFYFGAAGTGESLARENAALAAKWLGGSKIFMASVTPFYRSTGRVFEFNGFEGMQTQWEGIVKDKPTWVEVVTWNDYGEKTYVLPFGGQSDDKLPPRRDSENPRPNKYVYSHVAYLDASRYYIDWYKTGKQPTIAKDRLFYFYRVEPKSATGKELTETEIARGIKVNGVEKLKDSVFATVFLTKAATLTLSSGPNRQVFELSAGVHDVSIPFALGRPHFLLKRGGQTLVDRDGEQEIADRQGATSYNYFAGEAPVKLDGAGSSGRK